MRILLVEDDRMIADGVRKALRADGFAVDWVQDGDAALTALGGETYDPRCARAAWRCRC